MGLDTVEILYSWEEAFSIRISDEEAADLTTPRKAALLIAQKVSFTEGTGICLSMHAFTRLRRAFSEVCGVPRRSFSPTSKIRSMIPAGKRRDIWREIEAESNLRLPKLHLWSELFLFPSCVSDVVREVVSSCPKRLKTDHSWRMNEILAVVRAGVWKISRRTDFSDDAHFITDIGLD